MLIKNYKIELTNVSIKQTLRKGRGCPKLYIYINICFCFYHPPDKEDIVPELFEHLIFLATHLDEEEVRDLDLKQHGLGLQLRHLGTQVTGGEMNPAPDVPGSQSQGLHKRGGRKENSSCRSKT